MNIKVLSVISCGPHKLSLTITVGSRSLEKSELPRGIRETQREIVWDGRPAVWRAVVFIFQTAIWMSLTKSFAH